jgi:hypothetical protein
MTFFQLMVYSCVTLNSPMYGELISKTCDWRARDFYVHQEICDSAGRREIGQPIFSDMDEDRKVEASRCIQLSAR